MNELRGKFEVCLECGALWSLHAVSKTDESCLSHRGYVGGGDKDEWCFCTDNVVDLADLLQKWIAARQSYLDWRPTLATD
jgi:hypothetical protein